MAARELTLAQFRAEVALQELPREDNAFVCPLCGCIQSARDLIGVGAGADFEAVRGYVGFSCVGRFTGAGSARKQADGRPCDWTLGGLFQLHDLEVITPDGGHHPHFELATPEQAQAHAASHPHYIAKDQP
jgi:hypothetical protein